jgi:hypothetical protein
MNIWERLTGWFLKISLSMMRSALPGESLLMSERVVEMVHRLRLQGYTGKIWLYTANSRKLKSYWACKMLIDAVDGITYTIHNGDMGKVKSDLIDLRHLDTYLKESDRSGKSDRLYIDSRVFNQDYVDSLRYGWAVIKSLEWRMDDCPLPEGEELVFYDLEAEG